MGEFKTCSKCNIGQPKENFVQQRFVCKLCRKIHMQEYYEKNKVHILSHQNNYYKENKDKVRERYDKDKAKVKNQNYYRLNKKKVNAQKLKYEKNRLKTDSLYALSYRIRRSINGSLKNKGFNKKTKTIEILKCSFLEFKNHIENQFLYWMNWDNHGKYNGELNCGWDLDHIIPLCTAKTEEEIIKLNHYSNFQPLCSKFNRDIKRGRL